MVIAVIGGSTCSPDEAEIAEAVGRGLAERGITLVCGGLYGVMEAACRGAKSVGGTTIGILPGDSRNMRNPYVDIPIVTGLGYARNVIVVKSAQAVIAVGGSYGTLSEIAYALQSNIPVIGLKTWSLSQDDRVDRAILKVDNADEAVEKAIVAAKALEGESV